MNVRAVLDAQVAAWNAGDVEAFCALCTEDVVYLGAAGPLVGRAALAASYRARYPDRQAMGELALEVGSVEELGDAAFAVVRWSVAGPSGRIEGHALLGFRRSDGAWRLAYDATLAPVTSGRG